MQRAIALPFLILIALVAVACGSGTTTGSSPTTGGGGPLTVTDAWARPAPAGGESAVYFTITNGKASADLLLSASTDAAQTAGIHQTTTDASGMTGMQMTSSVAIPAGGAVQFAPGGYHVMLSGLASELKAGDQVRLTLTFQNAGTVTVVAEVRAN